jgi:hypothetical protein
MLKPNPSLTADQKTTVLPTQLVENASTKPQPKPNAENKTGVATVPLVEDN